MNVIDKLFTFDGASDPPVYSSRDGGPFVQRTVLTGGSPLVVADSGFMKLLIDATSEVQSACLYMADVLPYDIDDLQQLDVWAKLSTASLGSATSVAFGLASAYNADPDSIGAHALFRCIGSNAVVCETDDGTNDNDDVATGLELDTTVKRFSIDFASGVTTIVPPPSEGGKANVLFAMDDDNLNLRTVARKTRFDMSDYSSGLQFFAMISKTSSTDAGSLWIEKIRLRYKTS